jgi:MYXO-CTERM domain-containing protein
VLSACETGLGEIEPGQGVYGLRRALVLAGVTTQIMSLWKVDDDATRALMTAFYARLSAGAAPARALRDAELSLARTASTAQPYYWAAFIASGASDAPIPLAAARVATAGPRGCGCRLSGPGAANGDLAGLLATAILGVLLVSRRRSC